MKTPSRFFIASGCPIATTSLYRCTHLREQLESLGHEAHEVDWFDPGKIAPEAARGYDIIFLYRLTMCPPLERLFADARETGQIVIFDTDDLIFEPTLIEAHRGVAKLSAADQELHAQGVQRYLSTLLASNSVTTATPFLTEFANRRGKLAFTHRNALGYEMQALADRLYHERQQSMPNERVVIGYGSGTPTHERDFEEASAALLGALESYPQAELWIVGPLDLPKSFESFGDRVRRFPLTDWQHWFRVASQMDIAIAPLEMGNVFCRAKSEVKFIEAGALGVPIVASQIDPFSGAITTGFDGLLASDEGEWTEALQWLIERPEARVAMGARAHQTVSQRHAPEIRAAELKALLTEVMSVTPRV